MMQVKTIREWLDSLSPEDSVGIDEGGLQLQTESGDAWLEVGGLPEEEEADE